MIGTASRAEPLDDLLQPDLDGVVPIPVLIKGELVRPPRIAAARLRAAAREAEAGTGVQRFQLDGAQVIRLPQIDRATLTARGEDQLLVLPDFSPQAVLEEDGSELARSLWSLPFLEVQGYIAALREELRARSDLLERAVQYARATSPVHDQEVRLAFQIFPDLLDPEALAEAVDRELGDPAAPGRLYLDGWVPVPAAASRGMTARRAGKLFPSAAQDPPFQPRVRAMPTRQLHITAGNSPFLPLLSLLRAFATKGAAVVKSPAEATAPAALLALAMRAVDPNHPITRHTSLVYWPGGDRRFEDVLLAPGAFDRLVVWGSPETVRSVAARSGQTRTIFLNPRFGLSLIGREAFPDALEEAAVRAGIDTLIADQKACTASLVHYVEGNEDQALAYCRALKEVLARWDEALPHALPRTTVGTLRRLRRQELLRGTWFENGPGREPTSAVVYMPMPFDLSVHPMSRFVVVRRVDDLRQVLPSLHAGVSTVGVYPEARRHELLDEIAGRGVNNIFPLGECERVWAGMPHDGLRLFSELVSWTNA